MLSLAARNFSARKLRALSTALAVFFGVAMVAGTILLTESVNRSFDDLFTQTSAGIDVSVRPNVEVEGEFGSGAEFARPIDEALLDRVGEIEGVASAAGVIADPSIAILDEEGERVGPPAGGPPHIALSIVPEPFESLELVDGAMPQTDAEVAIDSTTAEEEGWAAGDTVRITGPAGASDYSISGIVEFPGGTSLGGASLAQFTLPEAQRLTEKQGFFDEIDLEAAEGVSPDELAAAAGAALPGSVEVATGADAAADDADEIKEGFGFLSVALLIFAGIAVFVGAFLIFNTFSITVAQRVREFAMLRTLGASARQVMIAVLVEAALVGLLASLLGIAGGFGFVELIKLLFEAVGFELPTSGLRLEPGIVLIALAVGVLTTVVSAFVPALRATRVAPLEAMIETAGGQTASLQTRSRRRVVIAATMAVAGVVVLFLGLFATDDIDAALPTLGLGLVLLFVGVAMVGDRFVPPLASALGWPIERLRGIAGRLARENAQRQPGRTATTAGALMIGVALVVFVGVFASSIRASLTDTLDRQFVGDIAVVNTDGFSSIPANVGPELERIDGVGVVSPTTILPARSEPGGDVFLAGIEPETLTDVANLEWKEGSDAVISGLGPDDAVIDENFAEKQGLEVGDELEVTGPSGDEVTATVAGITSRSRFIVDEVAMPLSTVRDRLGSDADTTVFANFEGEGAEAEATRARVDELLTQRFPNAEARSQDEYKADREAEIELLIALIYVLLGLSVLVSVFGVVNTLSLTILERTRELGMLRAIGTSRRQVRQMIRYESIVTALLGAVVGAVIGLALGIAAVKALENEGLELSVEPSLLITVFIAAIVIGIVAAIGPARRASRVEVVKALQYE